MYIALNIKKIKTNYTRDEFFKPSYSMIRQCLLNKNKNVIVTKSKNLLDLNKTIIMRSSFLYSKFKPFKISGTSNLTLYL